MELQIIKTKRQYEQYNDWIDKQYYKEFNPKSTIWKKVQVVLLLIKQYEDHHFPVPIPDPIILIKLKMLEKGLEKKDLVGKAGSKSYISALLNRTKPLTMESAKWFHREFGIPAEVLLS